MKKMNFKALIRPHIINLSPYSSARDEFKGDAEIFLDANENPYGSPLYDRFAESLNRYPDPYSTRLRDKLSQIKQISSSEIFIGNGSDETIDLLIRLFCEPGKDNILITPPTYGMYQVSANINNVEIRKSNLSADFQLVHDDLFSRIDDNTKIIFLCSPNNPTGVSLDENSILKVIQKFKGIVVVDEAYIDFSKQNSFIEKLKDFENLCIIQTFSKSWGLAGIRVGVLYANSELISLLNKIKPPYNVNTISQEIALRALSEMSFLDYSLKKTLSEKSKLISELKNLPCVLNIYESDANFILVKFNSSKDIYNKLVNSGIITRERSSQLNCDNCIRITIGSPSENQRLISVLNNEVQAQTVYNKEWQTKRSTFETKINVLLSNSKPIGGFINTGMGFFDHMLELFAFHSGMHVAISAHGDLNTDPHHTIEDIGITLGETLYKLLSSLKGYKRYGYVLPMDESKAEVLLDLSGRYAFVWNVEFKAPYIGGIPTQLFKHFFSSLAERLKCSLHITANGQDDHHIIEAIYKAFGRALRQALEETSNVQSTKGWL